MERFFVVSLVLLGIYFARSKLGDQTYERIVGWFFLISFSLVGLVLLYGYMMGR